MLTCKKATELLSESMERPLPRFLRLRLRFHVMICGLCRRFEEQILFVSHACRRYGERWEQERPDGLALRAEARERIKDALRREDRP